MTAPTAAPDRTAPDALIDLLEPVRIALVADASKEADRILAVAQQSVEHMVSETAARARSDVAGARRRAELASRSDAELLEARVRTEGHAAVLAAQEQIRLRLIDAVHTAARSLRHDRRYSALLERLEWLARQQLGDDAVIDRDPEPDGGIVATNGQRRVDYRLVVLADRALDSLADEVGELWA